MPEETRQGDKTMGIEQFKYRLHDLPPLRREGNIIYFPGAWREEIPEPPKAPEEPPLPSFEEHCEGFEGATFGSISIHSRIIWALYYLRIHSLDDLSRTPVSKLRLRNRIGLKNLECILAVLESRGYALGKDWDMVREARLPPGPAPRISGALLRLIYH
jgi:hypothetical protein